MEELVGRIQRVTYQSPETGYVIARMEVDGRADSVVIVGHLLPTLPGQTVRVKGEWATHTKYGLQFMVQTFQVDLPVSKAGIRKYLASGLLKGLGPTFADRIVQTFGENTLKIIDENPQRLREVPGIGKKRLKAILEAWKAQHQARRVMLFLKEHDMGPGLAARVYKQYGDNAVEIIQRNPFRLAMDVAGIGFATADRMAGKLGMAPDALPRAEAGLVHLLEEAAEDGHVYLPREKLVDRAMALLGVDRSVVEGGLGALAGRRDVIVEPEAGGAGGGPAGGTHVFRPRLHLAETGVALRVAALLKESRSVRAFDADRAVAWVETKLGIQLADLQRQAVRQAVLEKIMVVTGGPGTGKTTIIRAILAIYLQLGAQVILAAPTGRAAKRMAEATGFEARTIHRTLEFNPQSGQFKRQAANPLDADVVVVDEASMIDVVLMHHLLAAVPAGASVILVGDVDQLPSVGPGAVLSDIIQSGRAPVARLEEIFRQARESRIVVNAHRMNQGQMPITSPAGELSDFYFIDRPDAEGALAVILEMVTDRIPKRFGLDPMEDVQVLAPMHKGLLGTVNLNQALQGALNPRPADLIRGDREFRIGDKVMQTRNDYDKEVYNGDIGRVAAVTAETSTLIVDFDGRRIPYDKTDLDELTLSYAATVHKAQGSEYPAVILPILPQHQLMLERHLVYTAVTRGKRLVVLVGSRPTLKTALSRTGAHRRYTDLARRLAPEPGLFAAGRP